MSAFMKYTRLSAFALATIIALSFSLTPANILGAAFSAQTSISSVTRLNLSKGKISGEKLDYVFYLPSLWSAYLTADREKVTNTSAIIEKITFNYLPQEKNAKPVFMMNFYVYDKRRWKDSLGWNKLFETEEFVFATDPAKTNPMASQTDKAIFERLMNEANDNQGIASCFKLFNDLKIIYHNAVSVNGAMLEGTIKVKEGSTVYVPLREACELMGYQVGWINESKAVSLTSGNFYHLVLTGQSSVYRGYKPLNENGTVYVPTIFFIQVLGANVEIDENYNVFITTS